MPDGQLFRVTTSQINLTFPSFHPKLRNFHDFLPWHWRRFKVFASSTKFGKISDSLHQMAKLNTEVFPDAHRSRACVQYITSSVVRREASIISCLSLSAILTT